tara:strand:- start:6 stop:2345 length:2340 start_codon:yes stop_codon:yes gene_type:complete
MRVSYFKGTKDTIESKAMDIFTVLQQIKDEKYKMVISKIRIQDNKEDRDYLKKTTLPMVTFSGTFSSRAKSNLKKSSQLAMMDYDGINDQEELNKLKEEINNDEYTFSSFISPSGRGLKVLIKIPPVPNDEIYKEYYHELQKHFDKYAKTDDSTKDISRGTYLSIDSNLFLNSDSKTFTDKYNPPLRDKIVVTNIPITDQDVIAERLEKWFKKKYPQSINRNTNLHAFARQLNAFGVDQMTSENYLLRYQQSDFNESEVLSLVNSAYNYTTEFGVQSFEDEKKVQSIKMKVIAGVSIDGIDGVTDEGLKKEIEKHENDLKSDEFWFYTEKEVIKMATFRFLNYLENNNITKYYPSADSGYLYIKKDNNFIKEFNENRIKDFTLTDLRKRGVIDAFEMCANNLTTFNRNFLAMLSTSEIDIQRDNKNEAFVYYKNTAVKVTKDSFETIPYTDLKGLVWEDQVIDRDFIPTPKSEGEFKTFIWKISGEDKERYYTFKSVIGYLLHSHQNASKPKVIIFNDEMISDVPNGGSGKGLIHKGIGHIKKLSTINGKGFDPSGQFAYQTVDTDTQVLTFDDVDRNFNFENFFSLITEGLTIEKKGKDAIKIPFNESPKISITTNYTVKGEGGSHNRRVFEVEMAGYFNENYNPEDEFGHLLFDDWDELEWSKFDNYMLRCVQYYLNEGLVECKSVNLLERKLRNETSSEFIDFMDAFDWDASKRWAKTELKDLFTDENTELKFAKWLTTTKFNKWVKLYTDTRDEIGMTEGKSNGIKWKTIEKISF